MVEFMPLKLEGDVKIETVNGDIHSRQFTRRDDKYSSVNGGYQRQFSK